MKTPAMTKAHFEFIADIIRNVNTVELSNMYYLGANTPGGNGHDWMLECLAEHFRERLSATNPNFDGERFMQAATLPTAKGGA